MKTIASVTSADGLFEMHLSFEENTRQVFYGNTYGGPSALEGKCLEDLHDDDDEDCYPIDVAVRHWNFDHWNFGDTRPGERYAMMARLIRWYRASNEAEDLFGTPVAPDKECVGMAAFRLGERYSKADQHVYTRNEIRCESAGCFDHPVTMERAIDEVIKIIATWSK